MPTPATPAVPASPDQPAGATRRGFLAGAGMVGAALAAAACAPAAAPAATGGAPTQPAPARAPWLDEWDRLLEAAKKEGRLSVMGNVGAEIRAGYDEFEKAVPGITVDLQTFASSSLAIPKITQERNAGVYTFDVAVYTIQSLLSTLKPTGAFDPLRTALFRGDVVDDAKWRNGFEAGFMDKEKRWVYNHMNYVSDQFFMNTDLVKPGEIKSIRDLLDPKWKGKFFFADVRSGYMFVWMAAVRKNLKDGDEIIKKLLIDQEPKYSRDSRQITEQMARGGYAFATGVTRPLLAEFVDKGLGRNIKEVAIPEMESVATSGGGLWLFNKAPHPNAAKLFVNWALTKEGQQVLSRAAKENSRRLDVEPFDPSALADPKKSYFVAMEEDNIQVQTDARIYGEKLVGAN